MIGGGPKRPWCFSLLPDRLESLCHPLTAIWYDSSFQKKSPEEVHSPGLIPATGPPAASGLTMAGGLAGRRPIVGGRLIIALLLGLIIPLLLRLTITLLRRLVSPLRLRLIGGLRLPVGCSGHATPGSSEQAADSRTPPGIFVIDGGPQAGPQGRTQTRTRPKVGGLTRRSASRQKT